MQPSPRHPSLRRRSPGRPVLAAIAVLATTAMLLALVAVPSSAGPRRTKVSAVLSADLANPGGVVTMSGKIRDKGKQRRRVVLQQKTASGWRKVDRAKTTRSGRYSLTVPTHWLYSSKFRVKTKKTRRSSKATSKKRRMTVVPAYVPLGSSSSWSYIAKPKLRVNPCRKVTYGINTSRALPDPATAVAAIQYSIGLVAQATGIRFKYVGETSAMPFDRKFRKRDPKLVFGWTSDAETPLDLGPAVAARGGADRGRWARDARGRRVVEALSMGVIYDVADLYSFQNGMVHVTMHEIGHAMGLGHVDETDQQMNGTSAGYLLPNLFNAGDLKGLSKVGLEAGCLRPLRRRGHHRPMMDWTVSMP